MTGMISVSNGGIASGLLGQTLQTCIFSGILFVLIGLGLFCRGIHKEETAKMKNEIKK